MPRRRMRWTAGGRRIAIWSGRAGRGTGGNAEVWTQALGTVDEVGGVGWILEVGVRAGTTVAVVNMGAGLAAAEVDGVATMTTGVTRALWRDCCALSRRASQQESCSLLRILESTQNPVGKLYYMLTPRKRLNATWDVFQQGYSST
ncbi:hypothetical protein C8R44DRAFT_729042 [Mycena epipterygia]|nr:hypothetical protein C8R44DRAFT_729042 [Mycena epipterygia]